MIEKVLAGFVPGNRNPEFRRSMSRKHFDPESAEETPALHPDGLLHGDGRKRVDRDDR